MDKKISNELKILALEMINNAGSGHSGSVLSLGDAIYTLYTRHILTNGTKHMLRDRFVLSAGHACASLYSVLAGLGYIDFENLKTFRKFGGLLAGHPEVEIEPIDCGTGPLGQGVANSVGMAIAETIMDKQFGVDHYTYCLAGDGCFQEGVALEALSVAGLYRLNKLIVLYDKNDVTLDGKLGQSSTDDMKTKFKSMNLNVIECDGHNIEKIDKAIIKAKQSKDKPTVIILKTKIAKDTTLEGSNKSHGTVFDEAEINKLKNLYEIKNQKLQLNEETINYLNNKKTEINLKFNEKINNFNEKLDKNKELLKKYNNFINNAFKYKVKLNKEKNELRKINNQVLNDIVQTAENIVTLSADLSSSTKVMINNGESYSAENRLGRNIAVGIREHAMGSIANGIALHGGIVPVVATFLVFSNYMVPAIRMAGIMNLPVVFTFTHSSSYEIADGITHIPVEQLDQLRLLPNVATFRVFDSAECKYAYDWFFKNNKPMCLCVSKTSVSPVNSKEDMTGGAYFITQEKTNVNIVSSGADVQIALGVQEELKKENIIANVVSVPCLEVLEQQSKKFKEKIFTNKTFVIETSTCAKYFKYVDENHVFNVAKYGISGDSASIRQYYGLDNKNLINKIKKELKK